MAITIPEPSRNIQNLQQWLLLIAALATILLLLRTSGKE